jgi:hypothetical protein
MISVERVVICWAFNKEKWYLGSRFLPIESDIVSRGEFAIEFKENKILDHTLLAFTMIVPDSECCVEIGEIWEIDLHMSREFCSSILDPWTDSSDEIIFE